MQNKPAETVAQAVPLAADGSILPIAAAVPVAEAVALAAEAEAVAQAVAQAVAAEALAAEAALVAADGPGKMHVTRDEDIFKYQAILKKYSESTGTVFQVDPENNTVKVAEQASISQKPKDGLERIQEEVEVIRNGKPFTITAFTDVGKDVSKKDKKKIRKRLKGLVASIKNDKEFLKKLKEASDLKDGLSKDAESLLDNLTKKPDLGDSENPELKENISRKINELKALNTELGDKLSKNLKNRDLGKLEKFKNKISSIPKSLRNRLPTVLKRSTISQKLPPPPTDTIPPAAEEVGTPLVETAAAAAETAKIPLEAAKTPEPLEEVAPETLAKDEIKKVDEPAKTHEEIIPPASAAETAAAAIDAMLEHSEDLIEIDRTESALKEIALKELYKNHLKKYSESTGTVFQVDPENNTVKVAEQASISQKPKDGLERIQEKVEVIRNGKPFTITAFTDVGKRFTEENKKQIKENLENLVDASKIDEKFSEKQKESIRLKGELSEDINLLLRKLNENPNVRDHADLIYSIQVKINNLEALNKVLGDTLKENLNKKGLDKFSALTSKVEKSSIASLKESDFLDLEVPKETTPQDDRPVLAPSAEKAAAVAAVPPPPAPTLETLGELDTSTDKGKKFFAFTEAQNLGEKSTKISGNSEGMVSKVAQTVPKGVTIAKTPDAAKTPVTKLSL